MYYFKYLKKKISAKKACIGIIGLGYVGLPLSILFSKKGFKVYGFDIDKSKINKINMGISYINRISNEIINKIKKKIFFFDQFYKNFKMWYNNYLRSYPFKKRKTICRSYRKYNKIY